LGRVICVAGPTASGKSELAVDLALALGGEVVSCDSMQIYRGMDIGTAKPGPEERKGVLHHMIDIADPDENYSVSRYVEEASACVDDILRRGKVPVIAGGTGLYMDSLIKGLYFSKGAENGILRKRIERLYDRFGRERVHKLLESKDPDAARKIHPNDRKRVCRALEVCFSAKKPISFHNRETSKLPPRYDALYLGLDYKNRAALYEKIDSRVDEMFRKGLAGEVGKLVAANLENTTALQAIGYKEIIECLRKGLPPKSASEEIKRATRRYAKRQLTWFRRNPDMIWFYKDSQKYSDILRISTEYFRNLR
jgi:tRNA dimethylallyltransferase